jgi:hypothetical protein
LQELYDLINPNTQKETLTFTRLLALLAAVPTTIVFELLTGEAPFSPASAANDSEEEFDKTVHALAGILTIAAIAPLELIADIPVPSGAGNIETASAANSNPAELVLAGAALIVLLLSVPKPSALAAQTPEIPLKPWDTAADIGENLAWISLVPCTGWSCLCAMVGVSDRGNPVTCVIMTLCGVLAETVGVAAAACQVIAGEWNILAAFVSLIAPLPFVFKWLRFAEKWVLVLYGIDAVCFVGAGIGLVALYVLPGTEEEVKELK